MFVRKWCFMMQEHVLRNKRQNNRGLCFFLLRRLPLICLAMTTQLGWLKWLGIHKSFTKDMCTFHFFTGLWYGYNKDVCMCFSTNPSSMTWANLPSSSFIFFPCCCGFLIITRYNIMHAIRFFVYSYQIWIIICICRAVIKLPLNCSMPLICGSHLCF